MMISDGMNTKLNDQITKEFAAAHKYLAMSCAFDDQGYKILAQRFFQQYQEETEHALKILNYLQEAGGTVSLDALGRPQSEYENVESIVKTALDSEISITKSINEIVALADSENDYATRSFLAWFVDEQVEEVASMRDLLQLVQLANGNILQVEARIRHEMAAETQAKE
ncbi:MAG: ferritin [Planctomycetota bacterium]|jgi:ferritin